MGVAVANRVTPSTPSDPSPHGEATRLAEGASRLRLVVNNTVISLFGQAITWVTALILIAAYGRFLGATGFGKLYLAVTLVGLIGFPLEFGFNQQIIRDVAQAPARAHRYLASALVLKALLWLVLWGALILTASLLRYSHEEQILVSLSGLTLLASAIGAAFSSMHVAVHRNIVSVTGSIIEKSLDAGIAFVLLRFLHVDVIVVALVLLGGAVMNTAWQGAWFYRLERPALVIDTRLMREIMKTSIPFLLYGVFGVIYYRVDTLMLGAMDGDAVVGAYGAGYRLFDTLMFLPGIVMSTILYPIMARIAQTDPQSLKLAVEKSTNFLLICAVPLATGLAFAAPAIVGFLYHRSDFASTVQIIEALAPGLVLLYLNTAIGCIIISVNRERSLTWMAGVALTLNVALNVLLIPHYHAVAAAGVTSFTEAVLLVMGLRVIPRELIPLGSVPTLLKALAASAVMAVVILALARFSILAILPAAGLTYVAVGAFVQLIPREDVRSLLDSVRRKTSHVAPIAPDASAAPLARLEPTATPDDRARLMRSERTLAPAYTAWLEWLQAPTSSLDRARLVTRARSTSIPLTAAQRSTPMLIAAQRSTPLPVGQRARRPVAAPAAPARRKPQPAASNVRARRRKAARPRRAAHRVAVAI